MSTYIKPLTIGNLYLPTNIIQGPLAGYSCSAFRSIIWQFGGAAYCITEMLSAIDLVTKRKQAKRYLDRADNESLLAFQLAGNDPLILGQATKILSEEYAADIIDLNCGCPKLKVRKKGYGSRLLESPTKLIKIIHAMRNNTQKPLTIKIRLPQQTLENNIKLLKLIEHAGANAIIIHARSWQDVYDIPCRWDEITAMVSEVNIPIIANGDVSNLDTLNTVFNKTQCAGIMISRAGMGKPWLFQQLIDPGTEVPTKKKQGQLLLQHVKQLMTLETEQTAILQARGFAKYYARTANVLDDFCIKMKSIEHFSDLHCLVQHYFKDPYEA